MDDVHDLEYDEQPDDYIVNNTIVDNSDGRLFETNSDNPYFRHSLGYSFQNYFRNAFSILPIHLKNIALFFFKCYYNKDASTILSQIEIEPPISFAQSDL